MKTYGWDIVSACSQAKLNELLASRLKKTPPKVSYSDGDGKDIQATFDPWQITSFGSDNKLTLDLPIKSGTLKDTSKFAAKPSINLAGVIIEVTITLAFVDKASGSGSDLSFSLKKKATSPADKHAGAVYVKNPDVNDVLKKQDPSGTAATTVGKHIVEALIAHADKLSYALSTVNLQPGSAWMKPVDKAHMFAEGPKKANGEPGEGYLVVATMVRNLPAGSRSLNVDSSLFDSKYDFFMLVAGDVFLEQFVLPDIATGFIGNPHSQFMMSGDDIMDIGPLQCPTVDHWGTGYDPILTTFEMAIDGEILQTSSTGLFQITGLGSKATVSFSMTQNAECHYNKSGKSISFTPTHSPDPTYHKHIPWYEYAAALPLLPFFGPFIAIVVGAIVDGVIAAVTNGVAKSVTTSGGTGGLSGLSTVAVSWPGSGATKVSECGLSSAFYVKGTIN